MSGLPEIEVVYSQRRTLAVEIRPGGAVVVRAPLRCSRRRIGTFVAAHAAWIEEHVSLQRERALARPEPDEAYRAELIARARAELPPKVARYAALMDLEPAGITITGARTRFGSCSGKNRLCFSWRLMQYPDAAVDYVVVHELAHIAQKNHGPAFYALVERYMPDYRERRKLLKE